MISKEDLKKILLEWKEREFPEIIERDIKINLYPKDVISISGVRRSGKTFLLLWIAKKLSEKLSKEEILYINFEHELLGNRIEARDVRKFFEVHSELFSKNVKFILLDEIQEVIGWSRLVRRLYDERKYHIFITGSSFELRPENLSYELRGRTINYAVFPLSFGEFLRFKKYDFDKNKILIESEKGKFLKLLNEFVKFGGFPDVVLRESEFEKKKLISSYFDTIILRDIIEKHEIRNSRLLETFLRYLISSISFYFSATRVENYFKSIGEKCSKATLLDFFDYAENAFLLFKTEIFSPKIKERKQYPVKVYCIDNGFANFINPRFSENLGALMENLVAIELLRKKSYWYDNWEIFYWKDYQQYEADFVVKEGLKVRQLIQVTYASSRDEIEKRELKALVKASELLKCKNLLCITWDFKEEEEFKGKKIKFVPLWKWLLG